MIPKDMVNKEVTREMENLTIITLELDGKINMIFIMIWNLLPIQFLELLFPTSRSITMLITELMFLTLHSRRFIDMITDNEFISIHFSF